MQIISREMEVLRWFLSVAWKILSKSYLPQVVRISCRKGIILLEAIGLKACVVVSLATEEKEEFDIKIPVEPLKKIFSQIENIIFKVLNNSVSIKSNGSSYKISLSNKELPNSPEIHTEGIIGIYADDFKVAVRKIITNRREEIPLSYVDIVLFNTVNSSQLEIVTTNRERLEVDYIPVEMTKRISFCLLKSSIPLILDFINLYPDIEKIFFGLSDDGKMVKVFTQDKTAELFLTVPPVSFPDYKRIIKNTEGAKDFIEVRVKNIFDALTRLYTISNDMIVKFYIDNKKLCIQQVRLSNEDILDAKEYVELIDYSQDIKPFYIDVSQLRNRLNPSLFENDTLKIYCKDNLIFIRTDKDIFVLATIVNPEEGVV